MANEEIRITVRRYDHNLPVSELNEVLSGSMYDDYMAGGTTMLDAVITGMRKKLADHVAKRKSKDGEHKMGCGCEDGAHEPDCRQNPIMIQAKRKSKGEG